MNRINVKVGSVSSMLDPRTRIIIVDDMATMRKLVMRLFRELGFSDLLEASDGAKAWQAISSADPEVQLVVSDWNMPTSTGLDLLRRLRRDSRFGALPFVMLGTEADLLKVAEAISAGASHFLLKPFGVDALREVLVKL